MMNVIVYFKRCSAVYEIDKILLCFFIVSKNSMVVEV